MTTERTHLSIGEVLSLLQPEFPDITISKIRFLESQGLLDPERTPSGYRKFHDDDIDQLRWILTQQRDHFLPLKVIKERLAAGDLDTGAPEGVLPLGADRDEAAVAAGSTAARQGNGVAAAPDGAPRTSGGPPGSDAGTQTSADTDTDTDTSADTVDVTDAAVGVEPPGDGEGGDEAASTAAPADPSLDEAHGVDEDGAAPGDGADAEDGPSAGPDADPAPTAEADPDAAGHDRAEAVGRLVEAPADDSADEPSEEGDGSDGEGSPAPRGRRRHPTGHQPGEPTPEPGAVDAEADPAPAPRSISLDELVELSGLSPREVGELERYGLVVGDTDGQSTTFDEECLVVARLAAGFGRYGIEPRHLRMYKVAAEREAGLFEQLISPLLKQRRPSARQQAVEMLEDLAELADDLRAAMVRSALRDYLGGD